MRDIATMENNYETAQRTNQMALIEEGADMWSVAEEASYGGYDRDIVFNPIDLSVCVKSVPEVRYADFAKEDLAKRVLYTGREMAIRAYNEVRAKKEKLFLQPIILWLDGVKGKECIFPDPSNHLTMLTQMYNVRALLTTTEEIRFLKANYRLIVTPDYVKFIPHEYIVVPETVDYESAKKKIISYGIPAEKVMSLAEYRKKLGPGRDLFSSVAVVPGMVGRVNQYLIRNGLSSTVKKIRERLG